MKRERLTRAQRKEQTRECLLEAARKMFVKKGLAATSVEDIAEAAGYTRGAFYSNFGGKPDLLIRLLRRDDERARANLLAIMEKGGTPDEMKERVIAYYSQSFVEHDCFPLWVEAQLLACKDTRFRERIDAFQQQKLEQIGAYIRMLSERNGRPSPLQAETLAVGLMCLCDGAKFLRMCSPQAVSDKVLQTVLAGFFSSVLLRQPEERVSDIHRPDIPG
ncbi:MULTISPECIES: TetR/AcrR family transcriptional regulator [Paraburkholderia]|uniref:TetR/AcrR family transcriptional regulator n=1 Tax=Paraburkholderia TaxID=1822464 RepID=UPI000362C4D1|nr:MULTISPECIES: TetR/AcrR family transcriptional regulator [Paraburkholderia]MDH6147665.1 AcrR family transcriptional regulator [Paraburkholderia sp. WSM4179]